MYIAIEEISKLGEACEAGYNAFQVLPVSGYFPHLHGCFWLLEMVRRE